MILYVEEATHRIYLLSNLLIPSLFEHGLNIDSKGLPFMEQVHNDFTMRPVARIP